MNRRVAYGIVLAITLITVLGLKLSGMRREVAGLGFILIPVAALFLLIYLGLKSSDQA